MVRHPRVVAFVVLLALAACAKNSGNNSVWLAVKNDTGRHLHNFTLDYGTGKLSYQIFSAGNTFAEYARAPRHHALAVTYTDDTGARQTPATTAALSPDLVGGRLMLTLRSDGSIDFAAEPRTGRPPSFLDRLEDFGAWLAGAAVFLLLPPFVLLLRKLLRAGVAAKAGVKAFFANPARDGAVAALGLTYKVCPVRMFTMDPDSPISWYEGKLDGRMLGLLDHGRLWVGEPDSATLVAFARPGPHDAFKGRDFTEHQVNPLLRDEELRRLLEGLSPAVRSVGILAVAVEASFDWKSATAEGLVGDARALCAIRARVETHDPPLVRAVLAGDEAKVRVLIAAGADLEGMTVAYDTPVLAAAARGRLDILRLLLDAGAKPQPTHGWPFFVAAACGHLKVVKALIEAGVPAGMVGPWGGTALHDAATHGREDIVAYLLAHGCDPNVKNKDGATALGYARYGKHARVIELLTAAGAK